MDPFYPYYVVPNPWYGYGYPANFVQSWPPCPLGHPYTPIICHPPFCLVPSIWPWLQIMDQQRVVTEYQQGQEPSSPLLNIQSVVEKPENQSKAEKTTGSVTTEKTPVSVQIVPGQGPEITENSTLEDLDVELHPQKRTKVTKPVRRHGRRGLLLDSTKLVELQPSDTFPGQLASRRRSDRKKEQPDRFTSGLPKKKKEEDQGNNRLDSECCSCVHRYFRKIRERKNLGKDSSDPKNKIKIPWCVRRLWKRNELRRRQSVAKDNNS